MNAQNVSIRDEFSRLAASKLSDGGHWISVSGNDDNLNADETGPDERGYPRLSVIELATAIEPYFEIQSITLEAFGEITVGFKYQRRGQPPVLISGDLKVTHGDNPGHLGKITDEVRELMVVAFNLHQNRQR